MNLEIKRHSLAHILAQAVKNIYSDVKIATWPDTENGFYHDFDFWDIDFSEKDLKNVQKKMKKIIAQNQKFEKFVLPIDEAISDLKNENDIYKLELAQKLKKQWEKELSFYRNVSQQREEKIIDMCKGPHVEQTSLLNTNSFKLVKVAWAYWLWDEKNKMLTRIYAYAFENKEKLDEYLKMLEEAKKRDHRILWKKLDLFVFSDLVWSWLPLFTPEWTTIKEELQKEVEKICYDYWFGKVMTPHLSKIELFEISGHADKFSEELFHVSSEQKHDFVMKPVQCPHQTQIYASKPRSYKDLPIRYMESEKQYRAEKSWEVWWLSRVYAITVEDWHSFCTVEQVKEEVIWMINIIKEFYTSLWMWWNHWVSLSVRDYENQQKYIWEPKDWDICEKMLEEVSDTLWLNAKKCEWEAALYWPKIDFMFKNAIWKEVQIPTVQLDFATPKRFDLVYTDKDSSSKNPVMVHRAILWSYERFMMLLIEHFAGIFPLWLSPRQVKIIPVVNKFYEYSKSIELELKKNWIRVSWDYSSDWLNKKVRNAEKMHINYIIVIWEQEQNNNTVSVRNYKTKEQTCEKPEEFISRILSEINERKL
jgi:threonyl-tRNA synthetase